MLRKQSDLLLVIITALVFLGLEEIGRLTLLTSFLAIPFLFILPGYALISALFPASNVSKLQKYLYTLGASISLVILNGLVLNFVHWGLKTQQWVISLSAFIVVVSIVAILRRKNALTLPSTSSHYSLSVRQGIFFGLAIILIGGSIKLAITPQPPHSIQGYTSLWVQPDGNPKPNAVIVGIQSQEIQATHYRLLVTFNGQSAQEWSDVNLDPGKALQQSIKLPGGRVQVEAYLYLLDNPKVIYRHAYLVVGN